VWLVAGAQAVAPSVAPGLAHASCIMTEPGQAVRPAASLSVASTPTSRSAFHRSFPCLLPAEPLLRLSYPDYSTIMTCASTYCRFTTDRSMVLERDHSVQL
jgi:hypothetical protein